VYVQRSRPLVVLITLNDDEGAVLPSVSFSNASSGVIVTAKKKLLLGYGSVALLSLLFRRLLCLSLACMHHDNALYETQKSI